MERYTTGPDQSELLDAAEEQERYNQLLIFRAMVSMPLVLGLQRIRSIQRARATTDCEKIDMGATLIQVTATAMRESTANAEQYSYLIDETAADGAKHKKGVPKGVH